MEYVFYLFFNLIYNLKLFIFYKYFFYYYRIGVLENKLVFYSLVFVIKKYNNFCCLNFIWY